MPIETKNLLSAARTAIGYIPDNAMSLNGNVRNNLQEAIDQCGSDGWQPIETAPTDGTSVIVWCKPWKAGAEARYVDDEGWYLAQEHPTDYSADSIYPTHWMNLPKPPEA